MLIIPHEYWMNFHPHQFWWFRSNRAKSPTVQEQDQRSYLHLSSKLTALHVFLNTFSELELDSKYRIRPTSTLIYTFLLLLFLLLCMYIVCSWMFKNYNCTDQIHTGYFLVDLKNSYVLSAVMYSYLLHTKVPLESIWMAITHAG